MQDEALRKARPIIKLLGEVSPLVFK